MYPVDSEHFHRLAAILSAHEALWRPTPFHVERPDWCREHAALAAEALSLPEDRVAALAADNAGLIQWLARHLPALGELAALTALPRVEHRPLSSLRPIHRLDWAVPGRKQAQIEAFAGAVGEPVAPVLEWCAGKGHLGRLLAAGMGLEVTSLDHDAALCADGAALAERAGIEQGFVRADALSPDSARHLAGRHAVALHACGDLHLALLRGAASHGAAALDLAPCCYYRIAGPRYQPLNADAGLALSRDELRLPVTETVTAGARERRLHDRDMAWKLAYLALRRDLTDGAASARFKPVPAAWARLGFGDFIHRLARREGLALPAGLNLAPYEARGWQRRDEVARLGLARLAFRRALEVWLVLDRALFLRRAGYAVRLGEFCDRALTPRNLLISARP